MHEIISLADMEIDLLHLLHSFDIPTIAEQLDALRRDSNELSIDAEEGEPTVCNSRPVNFQSYGVGQLQNHPILRRIFSRPISIYITLSDVYFHISEYWNTAVSSRSSSSSSSFTQKGFLNVQEFDTYLSQKMHVASSIELGVMLSGPLCHDVLLLRHIQRCKYESEVAVKKRWAETSPERDVQAADQRSRLAMKPPPQGLQNLIDDCKAHTGASFLFSPLYLLALPHHHHPQHHQSPLSHRSFPSSTSQLRRCQKTALLPFPRVALIHYSMYYSRSKLDPSRVSGNNSKRGQKKSHTQDGDRDPLLLAATEYVMLHLGGCRYKFHLYHSSDSLI